MVRFKHALLGAAFAALAVVAAVAEQVIRPMLYAVNFVLRDLLQVSASFEAVTRQVTRFEYPEPADAGSPYAHTLVGYQPRAPPALAV